jgi:hypothetical protein
MIPTLEEALSDFVKIYLQRQVHRILDEHGVPSGPLLRRLEMLRGMEDTVDDAVHVLKDLLDRTKPFVTTEVR